MSVDPENVRLREHLRVAYDPNPPVVVLTREAREMIEERGGTLQEAMGEEFDGHLFVGADDHCEYCGLPLVRAVAVSCGRH